MLAVLSTTIAVLLSLSLTILTNHRITCVLRSREGLNLRFSVTSSDGGSSVVVVVVDVNVFLLPTEPPRYLLRTGPDPGAWRAGAGAWVVVVVVVVVVVGACVVVVVVVVGASLNVVGYWVSLSSNLVECSLDNIVLAVSSLRVCCKMAYRSTAPLSVDPIAISIVYSIYFMEIIMQCAVSYQNSIK